MHYKNHYSLPFYIATQLNCECRILEIWGYRTVLGWHTFYNSNKLKYRMKTAWLHRMSKYDCQAHRHLLADSTNVSMFFYLEQFVASTVLCKDRPLFFMYDRASSGAIKSASHSRVARPMPQLRWLQFAGRNFRVTFYTEILAHVRRRQMGPN